MKGLTIGIATRNRPAALERCLRSLQVLLPRRHRSLSSTMPPSHPPPFRSIWCQAFPSRSSVTTGSSVISAVETGWCAKPRPLMCCCWTTTPSCSRRPRSNRASRCSRRMRRSRLWRLHRQNQMGVPGRKRCSPGRGARPARVSAYIGFAHLLRRDAFVHLGGYRENLVFYGEEKDYCIQSARCGDAGCVPARRARRPHS